MVLSILLEILGWVRKLRHFIFESLKKIIYGDIYLYIKILMSKSNMWSCSHATSLLCFWILVFKGRFVITM